MPVYVVGKLIIGQELCTNTRLPLFAVDLCVHWKAHGMFMLFSD